MPDPEGFKAATPPSAQPLPATEPTRAARRIASGDGFTVTEGGAAPAPKANTRGFDPLTTAIVALLPGQHIRIKPERINRATLTQKVIAARKKGGHAKLRCYTASPVGDATEGDLIVIVDAQPEQVRTGSPSLK